MSEFTDQERLILATIAPRIKGFHPGQREMWGEFFNNRKAILFAGRGWGKSYVLTTAASYMAMKDPYRNILLTGADWTEAWSLLAMDNDLGIISLFEEANMIQTVNKAEHTIKLINGTKIWIKGAQEHKTKGGRGPRWDAWFGDEVGIYPNDDLIQNICLSERQPPGGRPEGMFGLITTTTHITPCTLYLKERMTDDWKEYTRSGREAQGFAHPGQVKVWDVMEATDPDRYRREVLCDIEMSSETAIMTREQIDKAKEVTMWIKNPDGTVENRRPRLEDFERIHICTDHNTSTDESKTVGRSENAVLVMGSITEHSDNKNTAGLPYVWVIEDLSMDGADWEVRAIDAYMRHNAERIVIETNQGGRYIFKAIKEAARRLGHNPESIAIKAEFSKLSKEDRALPTTSFCKSGRVGFMGDFPELEKQLKAFNPAANKGLKHKIRDDRADAFVFGITGLSRVVANPFRAFGK